MTAASVSETKDGDRRPGTTNIEILLPRKERLTKFCRGNGIARLEIFGSALRDDFGPESDIDLLVLFGRGRTPDLFDFDRIEAELTTLFGRKVDLVSRRAVEKSDDHHRKAAVLDTAREIYPA